MPHAEGFPDDLNTWPISAIDERFDDDLAALGTPRAAQKALVADLLGCIRASDTFFTGAGVGPVEFIGGIDKAQDYIPQPI